MDMPGLAAQSGAEETRPEAIPAPDFTVYDIDGNPHKLSDFRGKPILLNFWATWCPPCREELTRVQSEIIDRFAGQDFVFLPISRGEERHTVEAFRKRMGYTFPMGLDPDQRIFRRYANNYIPRNFLIDREGNIVGKDLAGDDLDAAIKKLL